MLSLGLGLGLDAQAFEAYPEFHWAPRAEYDNFYDPSLISGEFSSDQVNYWTPMDWIRESWFARHWMSISTGSISTKEFHTDTRLHLRHNFTERFEFRFTYLDDSQWEEQRTQAVMELLGWIRPTWGLSVMSSLYYNKDNNDVGFALVHRHGSSQESRIYLWLPDFQRNVRTHQPEVWSDHGEPKVLGFIHRQHDLEVSLKRELKSRLRSPTSLSEHGHERLTGQVQWFSPPDEKGRRFNLGLFYDDQFEDQNPYDSSSTKPTKTVRTHRAFARAQYLFQFGPHEFALWLNALYRDYRLDGQLATFRTLVPAFWMSTPWRGSSDFLRRWQLGYDVALHNTLDDGSILGPGRSIVSNDHRLNAAWAWRFGADAEVRWMFTFDLDQFTHGAPWEGGAGQLALRF